MSSPIKTDKLPIQSEIFHADYTQYKNQFNISELINPIFNKAKDLYCRYIESPAYLIANTQDTLIQKTMKSSNWIFEISPFTFMDIYFPGIQYFNPFYSKPSNLLTTPLDTTAIVSMEPKEPSCKDFEMSDPIVIDLTTTKIDTTAFSIEQIKKEISETSERMEISVNTSHCKNIKDLINHLGLTLNSDETDILPTDNPIISRILHSSHQGLFDSAYSVFRTHVMTRFPDKFPAQIQDRPLSIKICYNPKYPEKTEIFGEISFHIKCMNTGKILPYAYTVKTKCSLDKKEISWEAIKEKTPVEVEGIKEDDTESSFVIVNSSISEDTKKLDDEFVIVDLPVVSKGDSKVVESLNPSIDDEFVILKPSILSSAPDMESLEDSTDNEFESLTLSDKDAIDTDSDFHTTFDHLLKDTNSALKSGTTSEYLNSIKNTYPNFIYNDRLMYGNVPITTDKIIDSLNDLKKDHPSNQVIFLPFLVKGWTVDHAVVAVLNLSNETIEYFDPKGQSWFTTRAEKQSNKNVFDFLTEIGQKVISPTFSKEKVLYNKKNIPQGSTDNINCGVYCLQFIEERLKHSFDAIENGIVNKLTNPLNIRHKLANNFIKHTYSN